jgi:hypothetical protein
VSGKGERLARLAAIRKLNEELDRRDLQAALAAVAEVQAALARQRTSLEESKLAGTVALVEGDRCAWLMADAQSEVSGWNRDRLGSILEARLAQAAPAMAKFLESRREHEQVKQLVENARQAAGLEEDRRAQAAADDWFLSRRARPAD